MFDNLDGSYRNIDEGDRPASTTRRETKWQSTTFEGPIVEEIRRKKLGRLDAGQESLFGKEKCDYSSSNVMSATTGRKAFIKSYVPVRSQKTAD